MKILHILTLTTGVGAIGPSSLISSIRATASRPDVAGALAIAAQKSSEFAMQTVPQATVKGAAWVAANPGTTAACCVAGAGLAMAAAPGMAAAPVLGAVGFGAEGVAAGALP